MKNKTSKVACFLDPFNLECFKDLCALQKLDLTSWRRQMADMQPDILLVASTADEWKLKKNKMLRILERSKNNGIETVFLSINDEISDQIEKVSNRTYYLPMNYTAIQQDPSAISLYKKRVKQLLVGNLTEQKVKKAVSVITCTHREHFIKNVFANYNRQAWKHKELIIVLNNNAMDLSRWRKKAAKYEGISVYQVPEEKNLGACLNYGVSHAKYDYIAKLDDDDYYGPYYLTDMMHSFGESNADIVGKKAFFIYFEGKQCLALKFPNLQNRFVNHLVGATMVVKKKVFDQVSFRTNVIVGSDAYFLSDCVDKGFTLYAADKFNYTCIRRPDNNGHTWKVTYDELILNCDMVNCQGDFQTCVTI